MIHNLKGHGLALVIVVLVSAMTAPLANAEFDAELKAESSPVTLEGKDELGAEITHTFTEKETHTHTTTKIKTFVLETAARTFNCQTSGYHGEANLGDTSIALTPEISSSCETNNLGIPTITMNGCNYLLHLTANKAESQHTYTATTDLVCPAGKAIEMHFYSSHTNHTSAISLCTWHYGEQTGLGTVELTNKPAEETTPKDWVTADMEIQNVLSKRTSGPALICGAEILSWTFRAEIALKGTNLEGSPTGITIGTEE